VQALVIPDDKLVPVIKTFAVLTLAAASAAAQTKPVFTENFESGKIDPAVWDTRQMGTATIAVEPVEGGRGKYALHVHYPDMATGSYAFVVATHLPDSVRTHFFGRAYMKVSSLTGQGSALGVTHNPLIFAGEPGWQLSKFHEIGTSRGFWMPSYQENKSKRGEGRGEITFRSETAPPYDKWFLIEWEFNDDPSMTILRRSRCGLTGEKISETVAGEKVDTVKFEWPKASGTVKNLVGGYQEFGFGARVWGAPPTGFDVWYDDIAIGTSRVGAAK
jgi:hypothetical protein